MAVKQQRLTVLRWVVKYPVTVQLWLYPGQGKVKVSTGGRIELKIRKNEAVFGLYAMNIPNRAYHYEETHLVSSTPPIDLPPGASLSRAYHMYYTRTTNAAYPDPDDPELRYWLWEYYRAPVYIGAFISMQQAQAALIKGVNDQAHWLDSMPGLERVLMSRGHPVLSAERMITVRAGGVLRCSVCDEACTWGGDTVFGYPSKWGAGYVVMLPGALSCGHKAHGVWYYSDQPGAYKSAPYPAPEPAPQDNAVRAEDAQSSAGSGGAAGFLAETDALIYDLSHPAQAEEHLSSDGPCG